VLQLKQLGVEDVLAFPFMDAPPKAALLRALEQLLTLGALDPQGALTVPLGRRMARLPLEPHFAKVCRSLAAFPCAAAPVGLQSGRLTAVCAGPAVWRGDVLQRRGSLGSGDGEHGPCLHLIAVMTPPPSLACPQTSCPVPLLQSGDS
jgi:hypothetical protein